MYVYISGIACWNKSTRKWQDACLPITVESPLTATKIRTTKRAKSFGFTPINGWKKSENIHYRDFQTEFGETRRAFIIPKVTNVTQKAQSVVKLEDPNEVKNDC